VYKFAWGGGEREGRGESQNELKSILPMHVAG